MYKTNPLNIEPGYEFRGIAYRTFSGSPGVIEELFYIEGSYGIPKIDVDSNDIHVVFCAPNSPDPLISDKAIYLHGDLNLRNWDAPITLTNYNVDGIDFSQDAFDLAAKDGVVNFVWQNYDTNNYNIYSMSGTAPYTFPEWTSPLQLTFDAGNSFNPSCVMDSELNLHVVWQDDRSGLEHLRYTIVDASGQIYVDDIPLTKGTADSTYPNIAISQTDSIYLVWEDGRTTNTEIFLKRTGHMLIQNVKILFCAPVSNTCGIYLQYSSVTIVSNEISNNYIGICLIQCSNSIIAHNRIIASTNLGLFMRWSQEIPIVNNDFISNKLALSYLSSPFYITHNLFDSNFNAIDITNSQIVGPTGRISNNTIINGIGNYGIMLYNVDNSNINDNVISGNRYGLDFYWKCNDNQVFNNVISNNFRGIYIEYIGVGFENINNRIYHNYFVYNSGQAIELGNNNYWDNGYPSGGNYWSDWQQPDQFSGVNQNIPGSDGIVDNPRVIPGTNSDHYPLIDDFTSVTLNLITSWNFISIPAQYPIINGIYVDSAYELALATGAVMVSSWNKDSQSYINFIPGFHLSRDPQDFPIELDEAYWVWRDTPISFTLKGITPERPRNVRLVNGWNDVGYMDPVNIGDVETDWAWQVSCGAYDDIAYYDGTTFQHYILPGTSMDLVPGRGYFVWSDIETILTY